MRSQDNQPKNNIFETQSRSPKPNTSRVSRFTSFTLQVCVSPFLAILLLALLFVVTLLLWPTPALADGPTFLTSNEFGDGSPNSVVLGDVDNDGDLDIVTGNEGGQNLVYLNSGTGTFYVGSVNCNRPPANVRCFGPGADTATSVAVGDMNGDGHLDIVVGNVGSRSGGEQNYVYLNDGQGNFPISLPDDRARPFGPGTDRTRSVAVGDANGDGYLDIVVGNDDSFSGSGEQNVVYLNDGFGNFPTSLPDNRARPFGSNSRAQEVIVGDLNSDRTLDIIIRHEGNNPSVEIYLGNGVGDFFADTRSSFGDRAISIALGDVDGDRDFDLIVGREDTPPNPVLGDVFLNDGTGQFSSSGNLPGTDTRPDAVAAESLAVGDMDSDGNPDVVMGKIGGVGGTQSVIYLNDGQGNFPIAGVRNYGPGTGQIEAAVVGDVDSDAYLDIVTLNVAYLSDGPDNFSDNEARVIGTVRNVTSVAVGDLNGDAHLDLVIGIFGGPSSLLYLNDGNGNFSDSATKEWGIRGNNTYSIAVGDLDGDNDLDIIEGIIAIPRDSQIQNRLWLNDGLGNFSFNLVEQNFTLDKYSTYDLRLGDMDGDGDLDIVTANGAGPPQDNSSWQDVVYLNDGIVDHGGFSEFRMTPRHFGPGNDDTDSLALGDMDGDGDLDIVTGNWRQQNVVYLNDGQGNFFDGRNFGTGMDRTSSLAVGDMDRDGDLDIVAGNYREQSYVYLNDGQGNFPSNSKFGNGANGSESVILGDVDGDGDLDIVAGNGSGYYRDRSAGELDNLYLNDGTGNFSVGDTKTFGLAEGNTLSAALGDLDGDGALDLVSGDWAGGLFGEGLESVAYINTLRAAQGVADNPAYVKVTRPVPTGNADFYSSPVIINSPTISISYTLFDPEGNSARFIRAFYSPNGGGQWFPATPGPGGDSLTNLAASPTGTLHAFVWNAQADLVKSDNVVFRIEAYQGFSGPGPYQRPYASAQTFPFRVQAAEWYAKVVSGTTPLEGARLYQNGQLITTTDGSPALSDRAGLIRLHNPTLNQQLVALFQTHVQSTTRAAHDGWTYRTYLTSLNLDNQGLPHPKTISQPGEQLVTIRSDNPLILFNLVVSVEWDATNEYLTMLEDAFRKASAYLYDVTDGQMAFGQVTLYDKAQFWADADFQVSTKNTVRPYAFVGGITSADEAHTIRVGRFWSGGSGNSGNWNEPNGYRTLVHEFGHYALYLYDEYFLRQVDSNGNFIGQVDAFCTDEGVADNDTDASNASLMFYQYNASELADNDRWNGNCQQTEQHRVNHQADWRTVLAHYGGLAWQLQTPVDRGGVMAGPEQFPTHLLPFPEVVVNNSGVTGSKVHQLKVLNPQSQPVANALVALYTTTPIGTIAVDQGLTNQQGDIDVYGAVPGDTLRVATFDGTLAGAVVVSDETSYRLTLSPIMSAALAARAVHEVPYLSMTPQGDGTSLYLQVAGLNQGNLPLDAFVAPAEGGGTPQSTVLAYSPTEDAYVGTVALSGVGLGTGRVRVIGSGLPPGGFNSDYNLQQVQKVLTITLYSEDGNFELHIPPHSIEATNAFATVLPTGYVPGPLPADKQVIGSAYEVRLSGALTGLMKEGLVRLHFHPAVMGVYTETVIYYWDAGQKTWQAQGGVSGEVDNALSVPASRLGTYALMGTAVSGDNRIYLPVIVK